MGLMLDSWEKWYDHNEEKILADFFQFLKFQSIGTDPSFNKQTKACADWLVDYLNAIGLETTLWETKGQPIVFAKHCKAKKGRPTLLIYHHYDVQPVDPLNLWKSKPFEPTVLNGNVYARGAQDNKGQCFYTLTAIKALFDLSDSLNFNLKVFIEGEEESGSEGTKEGIDAHAEELACDSLLVIDMGIPEPGAGAITLGLRGIVTMDVTLKAAEIDMHSGALGGIAYNPIRALTTILSKCWDEEGHIVIDHFYDGVKDLNPSEKKAFDLDVDEKKMIQSFGLKALAPEPGFTLGESLSLRPTFEINGISGGYTGEGFKTVLPADASCKISCRLVPDQDPDQVIDAVQNHLKKHLPKGLELSFAHAHGATSFRSSGKSMIAKQASKAYEEVLEKPCKSVLSGGSIPIVVHLTEVCGGDVVMMGYGLNSDQIHAPNEHFGLDRFKLGFLTVGRILSYLNE